MPFHSLHLRAPRAASDVTEELPRHPGVSGTLLSVSDHSVDVFPCSMCFSLCVCVCERERERERIYLLIMKSDEESGSVMDTGRPQTPALFPWQAHEGEQEDGRGQYLSACWV